MFKETILEVCKNGNIWLPQNLTPAKLGAGGLSDDRSSKGPCYIRILRYTYTNGYALPQVLFETKAYWTIDWLLLLSRKISSAFVHCPIFNQIQNSFFSFTISKWLKISQSWIKPFFMAKTSQGSSGGLYRLCLNDSKLKYSSIHHFNHLTTVAIS